MKPGGIFAVYDCDWPPTLYWQVEQAYEEMINRADGIIREQLSQEKQAVKRDKEKHLAAIKTAAISGSPRKLCSIMRRIAMLTGISASQ